MSKIKTFEELISIRKEYVDATKKNGFDDYEQIANNYPDKAHFIYELLQNAEDANAHNVWFTLTSTELRFEHDGFRPFTFKDVVAITGRGCSTKVNDPTTIGKFGIGFKSVFAYTSTPEVHNGDFDFRLYDIYIPDHADRKRPRPAATTLFWLPFDMETGYERAVRDITASLKELNENTLLFLRRIHSLHYELPNGETGSLERHQESEDEKHITIYSCSPDGFETASHWLRYQKDVYVPLSEEESMRIKKEGHGKTQKRLNRPSKYTVSLAYRLEKSSNKSDEQTWKISPVMGNVSIFFPAVNEVSGLRFHIHAPFGTTTSRNSIRKNYAPNEKLCVGIADLVVASLYDIRDRGLLNMSFLEILPYKGELDNQYKIIEEKVIDAFNYKPLTPTQEGTYDCAKKLHSCPADISDVLSSEDMELLFGRKAVVWAANAPQKNSNADRFLTGLNIAAFTWNDLQIELCSSVLNDHAKEVMEKKSDLWITKLYILLGDTFNVHKQSMPYYFEHMHLVKGQDGNIYPGNQLCFPPEEEVPQDAPVVNSRVLGRSDNQKKCIHIFLQQMGVKDYSEKSFVEMTLQRYTKQSSPSKKQHSKDIRLFLRFYKNNKEEAKELFKNAPVIFYAVDDVESLSSIKSVYLDKPYVETGLDALSRCHKKKKISSRYMSLSPSTRETFLMFLRDMGCMDRITIEKVSSLGYNPKKDEIYKKDDPLFGQSQPEEKDFHIPNFSCYIKNLSMHISFMLWQAMLKAPEQALTGHYRRRKGKQEHTFPSAAVLHFQNTAWVAARDGKFYKPQDMTREMLPENFPYDPNSPMLKAIDFGLKANLQDEEKQRQDTEAKALGFSSRDSAQAFGMLEQEIKDLGGDALSILRSWKSDQEARKNTERSFRDERAPNPEYRRERAREAASSAPAKEYKKLPRSVAVGQDSEAHKAYLRALYSNPSTTEEQPVMTCQMCHETMPFRLPGDGRHYFECHEIFRLDSEHDANHAALCPLCAAKFRYLVRHYDDDLENLKTAVLGADINKDKFSFPVKVAADKTEHIHFKHRHLIDLQSVLSVTAMPDIEEDQE